MNDFSLATSQIDCGIMPTPDLLPAIDNTEFQTQYIISREGSGVSIEISQNKKVHTVSKIRKKSCTGRKTLSY